MAKKTKPPVKRVQRRPAVTPSAEPADESVVGAGIPAAPLAPAVLAARRRVERVNSGRPGRPGRTATPADFAALDPDDAAIPFDRVPYVPGDLKRVAIMASLMIVLIILAAIYVPKLIGT